MDPEIFVKTVRRGNILDSENGNKYIVKTNPGDGRLLHFPGRVL
jgi:hypothetical protein